MHTTLLACFEQAGGGKNSSRTWHQNCSVQCVNYQQHTHYNSSPFSTRECGKSPRFQTWAGEERASVHSRKCQFS